MLAFKRANRAEPMVGVLVDGRHNIEAESSGESDGDIDLWGDTVGDAAIQLGLVLSLALATKVIIGLLSDLAAAFK